MLSKKSNWSPADFDLDVLKLLKAKFEAADTDGSAELDEQVEFLLSLQREKRVFSPTC